MAVNMHVFVKKLNPRARLPLYGSAQAAGADLFACLDVPVTLTPGQTVLIPTGLSMAIPEGFAGLICARSGLSVKRGLAPANKVGVVDPDYRGECMVPLHNHSGVAQTVEDGERVAQLLITPVVTARFLETGELGDTERGAGGFGSTGRK